MILLEALVALPFLGALAAYLCKGRDVKLSIMVAVAFVHLGLTILIVKSGDRYGEIFGIDEIGRLLLFVTSAVNVPCSIAAVDYIRSGRRAKSDSYAPCHLLFLGALSMALSTLHMGVFWVAIEATTLATAPLIYNHRSRESLEATWKFLVLCSVGIALALLGTFCMAIALSGGNYPTPWDVLSLPDMLAAARSGTVDKLWLRTAFVLSLIGYGTKMGLAPMHSWMPDAYCESPSPTAAASSLLSNTAFLGILRMMRLCDAAGEADFARTALIVLGTISIVTAAVFLHGQRDFKRMLAYSSLENMGLIAFGVGVGGLAALGATWLMANHSVIKAMLFLCAGSFVRSFDSHAVAEVKNGKSIVPITSVLWICGILAISGMPPFGIFPAKLMILFGGIQAGRMILIVVVILSLAWIFLGMTRTTLSMVFDSGRVEGDDSAETHAPASKMTRSESIWFWGPAIALGAISVLMGLAIPGPARRGVEAASKLAVLDQLDRPIGMIGKTAKSDDAQFSE